MIIVIRDSHTKQRPALILRLALGLLSACLILTPLLKDSASAADLGSCDAARSPCDPQPAGLTVSDVTTGASIRGERIAETSPIATQRPVATEARANAHVAPGNAPETPWYKTTLGIVGIGVAATGATMALDRDINRFAIDNLSSSCRNHAAPDVGDLLTGASLAFAGATMFQSPWSDARLAHASSVAVTAAVITVPVVFGLKFAVGRHRPGGPGSSPYEFHPFSPRYNPLRGSNIAHPDGGDTASFPSGHTAVAFAVITPYAEIYHRPWLYSIPVAVGVSRIVAANGHWASDVVAGGFLGWLTADLTRRYFPASDFGVMLFGDRLVVHKNF